MTDSTPSNHAELGWTYIRWLIQKYVAALNLPFLCPSFYLSSWWYDHEQLLLRGHVCYFLIILSLFEKLTKSASVTPIINVETYSTRHVWMYLTIAAETAQLAQFQFHYRLKALRCCWLACSVRSDTGHAFFLLCWIIWCKCCMTSDLTQEPCYTQSTWAGDDTHHNQHGLAT